MRREGEREAQLCNESEKVGKRKIISHCKNRFSRSKNPTEPVSSSCSDTPEVNVN
jgi:hypothetical protein